MSRSVHALHGLPIGAGRSSRFSGPKVMERPLPARGGDVFLASLMVKQADDDVPHDRTPHCLTRVLIMDLRFRPASRSGKMASSDRQERFVRRPRSTPPPPGAAGKPRAVALIAGFPRSPRLIPARKSRATGGSAALR